MSVQGLRMVITGGAVGIGAGTARLAASRGAKVVISDLNDEAGEALAQEIKDAGGEAVCACDEGWGGDDCGACADDWQDNDGDGVCEPGCAAGVIDCGDHGFCADDSGQAECTCLTGHAGADCSECMAGYQDNDPLQRLITLKWYLRAITNAIIDSAIHVDGMTREAAMKLMIETPKRTQAPR